MKPDAAPPLPAPRRRRRWLRRVLLVAAAAVAIAVVVAWFAAQRLLESAFEAGGGRLLGGPVKIGRVDLGVASRSVALRDVTAAAPSPGAAPWLRVALVHVRLGELQSLTRERHLAIAEVALSGVEVTLDSRVRGPSSLPEIEDRFLAVLGLARAPDGSGFVASSGGVLGGRSLRRLSIERVTIDGLRLLAIERDAASGARVSRVDVAQAALRGLALAADGDGGGALVASLHRAELRDADDPARPPLARLARARAAGEIVPRRDGAGAAAVALLHRLSASEIVLQRSSAADPGALGAPLAVWRAAAAGVQLPPIALLQVERAQLRRSAVEQLDVAPDPPIAVSAIDARIEQLCIPARCPGPARARLAAHPVRDSARVALRAAGPLGDPLGREPIQMTAEVHELPLAQFSEFYLTSGLLSGRTRMRLVDSVVSGTAQVRLTGPEASPGAPLALAVGYRALAAASQSAAPDLTVPFSVRLEAPTRIDLTRSVLGAVVASARSAAVRPLASSLPDLGGAVRDGVDRTKELLQRLP